MYHGYHIWSKKIADVRMMMTFTKVKGHQRSNVVNLMIDTCHGHPGMLLFCSMCTDGAEVSEILSKLNISKSPGPDGISSRLLKLASPAVANTLAKIFNISIESGTFPEDWKKANVVPIYKKGAKDDFRKYRPVSLCSTA